MSEISARYGQTRTARVTDLLLASMDVLSDVAGRITSSVVRRVVKSEAFAACGVYCTLIQCNDTAYCPYVDTPNSFRCYDKCLNSYNDYCFGPPCNNFCWYINC